MHLQERHNVWQSLLLCSRVTKQSIYIMHKSGTWSIRTPSSFLTLQSSLLADSLAKALLTMSLAVNQSSHVGKDASSSASLDRDGRLARVDMFKERRGDRFKIRFRGAPCDLWSLLRSSSPFQQRGGVSLPLLRHLAALLIFQLSHLFHSSGQKTRDSHRI